MRCTNTLTYLLTVRQCVACVGSDNPEMCRAFCEHKTTATTSAISTDEHFVMRCQVILGDVKVTMSQCLSAALCLCMSVCVCLYVRLCVCLSVCLAPVTVPTDWTRHENVRHTHHLAGFLRTAGGGEAATRRSAQALQGRTEAEPEDLCNTTDRAQQRHDCPRIFAISLP